MYKTIGIRPLWSPEYERLYTDFSYEGIIFETQLPPPPTSQNEKINLSDTWLSVDKKGRNIACSLYDHAPTQESLSQGEYKFWWAFLGHNYYTLSLSDLCLGVEKTMFKEIMYFHYITYMAIPQQRKPLLQGS